MILKSIHENKISEMLINGSIGVIPTDTVYGIVCLASYESAVKRLYGLKSGRERKPGTIIAANIEQLVELGIKSRYLKAVENFWPNPLSIIIPLGDSLEYLHQGMKSIPVRIPLSNDLASLLKKTGPLLTTSANTPGSRPAANVSQAEKYLNGSVDFYVDGGELNNPPSTIIKVIDDAIEIVREGVLKIDENGRISSK